MHYNQSQVQAVRLVSKDNLDSPTINPAPTVYFDCHSDPATGKSFVLWDDILFVFTNALYLRHEAKVLSFMKDAELMPLKPLRIEAVPDAVLDIVVDTPVERQEAALRQGTPADTPNEATARDTPHEDATSNLSTSPASDASKRDAVYVLVEADIDECSHTGHPENRPTPRALTFVPTAEQEEDANGATPNAPNLGNEPLNDGTQSTNDKPASQSKQSAQDHTAVTTERNISPIVVKASLGDPISQVELGDMYKTGDGVARDFEEARYWYLKAANQGDPSGQCNLGHLYRLALGVERNHSTALSWYRKAAVQGDAGGQCYVGLVHQWGLVGPVDYSAAMDGFLMAANQGHAFAQCCIGTLYALGCGVEQDHDKAMKWYIQAADQGLPDAQFRIGLMYLHGTGVSEDETIALDWLSKATSRKDVDAWSQFAMGMVYSIGLGVPKSNSTALTWFLKAARQGSPHAQYIVGCIYLEGEEIPHDYPTAMSWFIKSANHNESDAQYKIGTMYLRGQGVPKDYSKAKEWYTKAANLGHERARFKFDEVSIGSMEFSWKVGLLFIFIILLFYVHW